MRRARIGGSLGQAAAPARRRRHAPATLAPWSAAPDDARRRRIAIALVALAVVLFILELVAIAVGLLEVAALIFVIFVGGWFALRSYQRRTGGA